MKRYFLYTILFVTLLGACQRLLSSGGKLPKGNEGSAGAPAEKETDLVKEAGIKRYFLNVNGDNRTFLLQLPIDYNSSETYPVIFFFHSIHGRDTGWIKNRNINKYIDKYKYIAVYGQGMNGGIWNIGGYYPFKNVSEPDYVKSMYNWLKANINIDTRRVYAVGTSNGALLAHYLAIQTNIFAAIVPISGSLYTDEMKADIEPTAVLQVHGMQDKTIPYNGGYTQYKYTFLSAENSVKTWATVDGCNTPPIVTNLLGGSVIEHNYTNCKSGKPAILFSIPNSPHKVLENINNAWLYEQVFDFLSRNQR